MIDFHLHLDGSLRPATAWELLRNKNIINFNNIEEARKALEAPEDCKDLNEYLKRFDYPIMILQREEEIIRAVKELALNIECIRLRFCDTNGHNINASITLARFICLKSMLV